MNCTGRASGRCRTTSPEMPQRRSVPAWTVGRFNLGCNASETRDDDCARIEQITRPPTNRIISQSCAGPCERRATPELIYEFASAGLRLVPAESIFHHPIHAGGRHPVPHRALAARDADGGEKRLRGVRAEDRARHALYSPPLSWRMKERIVRSIEPRGQGTPKIFSTGDKEKPEATVSHC